jgi:hypothetical protein
MAKTLQTLIAGVILTAFGCGLVKSCVDNYYDSFPRVVYLVDGKEVLERRFKTNEELKAYTESEQGKAEAKFYLEQNSH